MRNASLAGLVTCLVVVCVAGRARAADADPSVAPMRAVIDRYAEDRGALSRTYDDRLDPQRRQRLAQFLDERAKQLESVDFDHLDQAGRVDYLLLRNELRFEQKQLAHRQKELDESASLLPFAQTIVDLERARRRVEDLDPEKAAKSLTEISRQASDARKALEAKLKAGDAAKKDLPTPV